jgi:hypothetical protein
MLSISSWEGSPLRCCWVEAGVGTLWAQLGVSQDFCTALGHSSILITLYLPRQVSTLAVQGAPEARAVAKGQRSIVNRKRAQVIDISVIPPSASLALEVSPAFTIGEDALSGGGQYSGPACED